MALKAEPAQVKQGKPFSLIVSFENRGKVAVFCSADYAKPSPIGFQPDGKHISPSRDDREPLLPGPQCRFPATFGDGPAGEMVPMRYYGFWHMFRTEWVRVEPGQSRLATFPVWGVYFGGRYLGAKEMKPGAYTVRAIVKYKVDGPEAAEELTATSEGVRVEIAGD